MSLKFILSILIIFASSNPILSQTSVSNIETENLNELIDLPTSGILPHSEYELGLRVYPNGGVLTDFSLGLYNRVQATVYFGGENIIGENDVIWNPRIGFEGRIRIIDETLIIPAISIGINTQGFGSYIESSKRYRIKSRGIYAVGSRNYISPVGNASIHFGTNISLETDDEDKDLNFFAGGAITINNVGEAMVEYDLATNDNENASVGEDKGYLNFGFRFFVANNFKLAFYFKNFLENTKDNRGFGREIKIEYRSSFKK